MAGLELEYFFIRGRGFGGYVKNLFYLRRYLRKNHYDLIHAHYSFSGFIASFAKKKLLIVSLMGSDVYQNRFYRFLIRLFNRIFWTALIVKTERMKNILGIDSIYVIPNGIEIERFKPMPQELAKLRVGFDHKKHIIFVGSPNRPEKKFDLAQNAVNLINDIPLLMDIVTQKPHDMLPYYMNAADLVLLTSKYEGSPNVIKEAMACNVPIVSTDVGDVKWVMGDTEGCFLTSYSPEDVAQKIRMALDFNKRTNGRQRIIDLGLDSGSIAQRLINVYKELNKSQYIKK